MADVQGRRTTREELVASVQLPRLLETLQAAETAAAWLAQEAEAELRKTPNVFNHPYYVLWRIADGVARWLMDLREEFIAINRGGSADDPCVWCGQIEAAHGSPGASASAQGEGRANWRLCPVPGATSQFYTRGLCSSIDYD